MNVFILTTGRSGSSTFARACRHITNFTSEHESRNSMVGPGRVAYPTDHIEVDNRLSWFLGRLDQAYGDDAFYVHLQRNVVSNAKSWEKRANFGITQAYRKTIIVFGEEKNLSHSKYDFCVDMCNTVNANILSFLKDKTKKMDVHLENCEQDFTAFWQRIGAEGDFRSALAEWKVKHNASPS